MPTVCVFRSGRRGGPSQRGSADRMSVRPGPVDRLSGAGSLSIRSWPMAGRLSGADSLSVRSGPAGRQSVRSEQRSRRGGAVPGGRRVGTVTAATSSIIQRGAGQTHSAPPHTPPHCPLIPTVPQLLWAGGSSRPRTHNRLFVCGRRQTTDLTFYLRPNFDLDLSNASCLCFKAS